MNVSKKIVVLFLLGCLFRLTARPQGNPLSPPAPATRDSPSSPPAYWQQQVDYTIDVTLDDTVVDDVRVQVGQVQVRDGLDQDQHDDDHDLARVRPQVGAEQPDQHGKQPARDITVV